MVLFEVTSDVHRHRINPNYLCVRLVFDLKVDDHVHIIENSPLKLDWLPRDVEVKELVVTMAKHSPTFLAWLRQFMQNLGPQRLHDLL